MYYLRLFLSLLTISTFSFPSFAASINKHVGNDEVELQWNASKINKSECPSINGTVFSFSGNDGRSHSSYEDELNELETKLGSGCIRLIRVNINPYNTETDSDNNMRPSGYWRNHTSYRSAAMLMIEVIEKSKNTWKDTAGNYYANGKIIVVGISAGATIAASALEILPDRRVTVGPGIPMRFDRTIMLSGPFGADVSKECKIIEDEGIKRLLDKYFAIHTCSTNGNVDNSKDVVDISNKSFRSYLDPSNEIAIFYGKYDCLGCAKVSIGGGIGSKWRPVTAVERYIKSIGGGDDSFFTRVSEHSGNQGNLYTHMLYEVDGYHEIWGSKYVREQVCKHAFDEVNELLGTADKLSLDDCE